MKKLKNWAKNSDFPSKLNIVCPKTVEKKAVTYYVLHIALLKMTVEDSLALFLFIKYVLVSH